jgi:hypothetical protein
MYITSARYIKNNISNKNEVIKATIDGIEMFVPIDPTNRHYEAILEWVADGNTIEAAE